MKYYGIDLKGLLKVQKVETLPIWSSDYERSIIYNKTNELLYYGTSNDWSLIVDLHDNKLVLDKFTDIDGILHYDGSLVDSLIVDLHDNKLILDKFTDIDGILHYDGSLVGGGLDWEVVSINTTAVKDKGYLVNATSNNVTILLPVSPVEGDSVGVCDAYNKATINIITVARNLQNIEGVSQNLILDINGSGFIFVYVDSTIGWKIVSETGTSSEIITNTITVGDTTHAPDGNIISYTLALKAPLISPSFTTPALGTPVSGNLSNCTFPTLNQSTSGTSANLSGTPTLPTGTTLVAPVLGTPASGNLVNCTFPTLNQSTSGTSANLSGTPTLPTGTTLVAPVLGTPASGNLVNCTGLDGIDDWERFPGYTLETTFDDVLRTVTEILKLTLNNVVYATRITTEELYTGNLTTTVVCPTLSINRKNVMTSSGINITEIITNII